MADDVVSTEDSKDEPKGGLSAVYEVKPTPIKVSGKSVNIPSPAGNLLVGGGANEGILAEMQKLIEEREAQKKLDTEDAKFKETIKQGVEKVRGVLGMKKGGKAKC